MSSIPTNPGSAVVTSNQELRYGLVLMGSAGSEPAVYHRQVVALLPCPAPASRAPGAAPAAGAALRRVGALRLVRLRAILLVGSRGGWGAGREYLQPARVCAGPALAPHPAGRLVQSLVSIAAHCPGHASQRPGAAGRQRLLDRAQRVLNLCLAAPQHEGAFPVVAYWDASKEQLYWERDNTWAGIANWYHCFDMCWAGYWLLAWHEELQGSDPRILPRCRALGDLLLRLQLPSGCIPSFLDADLTPNRRYLYDDNAETAGVRRLPLPPACAHRRASLPGRRVPRHDLYPRQRGARQSLV